MRDFGVPQRQDVGHVESDSGRFKVDRVPRVLLATVRLTSTISTAFSAFVASLRNADTACPRVFPSSVDFTIVTNAVGIAFRPMTCTGARERRADLRRLMATAATVFSLPELQEQALKGHADATRPTSHPTDVPLDNHRHSPRNDSDATEGDTGMKLTMFFPPQQCVRSHCRG